MFLGREPNPTSTSWQPSVCIVSGTSCPTCEAGHGQGWTTMAYRPRGALCVTKGEHCLSGLQFPGSFSKCGDQGLGAAQDRR